jgi:hypothetical protein
METNAIRLPACLLFGVAAIMGMSALFGSGDPTPADASDDARVERHASGQDDDFTDTAMADSRGSRFDDDGDALPGSGGRSVRGAAGALNRELEIPDAERDGFLAANHRLILPPPNPTMHTWRWEDDRTQIVFEACKAVARDPLVPRDSFAVRAPVDFDALAAVEEHFGFVPDEVFSLRQSGGDEERTYSLDAITEPAYREALAAHGISLEDERIRVDFGWVSSKSAMHLRPLAESIIISWRTESAPRPASDTPRGGVEKPRPGNGPRHDDRIEALTSFVQRAVPYQAIPETPTGIERCGLRTPGPTLLFGGDCDSKAALLAALIRGIDEHVPLVMVSLSVGGRPHVLLGVGIPAQPCSTILDYRGVRYVLIEVTSALGVGIMAPDYNEAEFEHYAVIP